MESALDEAQLHLENLENEKRVKIYSDNFAYTNGSMDRLDQEIYETRNVIKGFENQLVNM